MFIKNPTPSLTPAPVPTLNGTIAHSHASSTPTNTQLRTSDSPGPIFLIQAKHDRYPTEERVLGESEQIAEEPPTKFGSLTDETTRTVREQSWLVLFVESDGSDSFSAPQNPESGSGSGGRVLVGIANEPTDTSPLKPVGELPTNAPKVEEPKSVEYTIAIVNGRDSAQPEYRATNATQESDTRVSLPALMTQPFPSIPEVMGQDDCADQPSEERAVNVHGKLKGVNGHAVEEEESKTEHVGDAKDEVQPALLPSTSPTPGGKEGSQGTNPDAHKSNAYLAAEDQPHPAKRAKKHSETDAAPVVSVRDFCRV